MGALTPTEERQARIIEATLRGEDPIRTLVKNTPRRMAGLMQYKEDRLEQLLQTLLEAGRCEDVDREMFRHLTYEDRRRHLAERCIEGLRAADQYYKNKGRM